MVKPSCAPHAYIFGDKAFCRNCDLRVRCKRRKLLLSGIILLFFSICCVAAVPTRNLQFSHIVSGHEVGNVLQIIQDDRDFIWVAGENGLARYDGYEFKVYRNDPDNANSLSNSYIESIVVDEGGNLWIATSSGLNFYNQTHQKFTRYYAQENHVDASSSSRFSSNSDETTHIDNQVHRGPSHNKIRDLLKSRSGKIWLATGGGGLNRLDFKENEVRFIHSNTLANDANALSGSFVNCLAEDGEKNIWLGTKRDGIARLNPHSGDLKYYKHSLSDRSSLASNEVEDILVDSAGLVWIGTRGGGLNVLDPTTDKVKRYPFDPEGQRGLSSTTVMGIFEDKNNNIWVGSENGGLYLYLRESDSFIRFMHDEVNNTSIANNVINSIFEDKDNNIWLGAYNGTIDLIDFYTAHFENYKHVPREDLGLRYGVILSFTEDFDGNLWVGTEGGLFFVDRKTGKFDHYFSNPNMDHSLQADSVISLLYDSKGRLWVGTWGGGLSQFDYKRRVFQRYFPDAENPRALKGSKIWSIKEDKTGVVWVGTEDGGLHYYASQTDDFTWVDLVTENYENESINSVWSMHEDSTGKLWVGTLRTLVVIDEKREAIKHYFGDKNDPSSMKGLRVKSILEDNKGFIWAGPHGGGLNKLDVRTGKFTHYSVEQGLPSNIVNGILMDNAGFLWVATEGGLARFDRKDESFTSFDKDQGLACSSFVRRAYLKSRHGEMIFGCNDGYSIFDPENIVLDQNFPRIEITDFKIFNRSYHFEKEYDERVPLHADKPIRTYIIDHSQSVVSFEFAALGYRQSENYRYTYRLEGFDKKWSDVGSTRSATYTNLDGGTYYFRVRSTNALGEWSDEEATVELVVSPPWWDTPWAYLLYVALTVFALLAFYMSHKVKVRREQERIKYLEEINRMKDNFLANTSHELRTPLNGIIGLAESLREGATGELPELAKHYLSMIVASGSRLATLVTEILDLSTLNTDRIQLNCEAVSLHECVELVLELAKPLVRLGGPELVNRVPMDLPYAHVDPDRIQQIFHNLIDNAIKYTESGVIAVSCTDQGSYLSIIVSDTGVGIAEDKLMKIFDSFAHVEEADYQTIEGSGLGLALVRKLVELHKGRVTVSSELGQGTQFRFTLPKACSDQKPINLLRRQITQVRYAGNGTVNATGEFLIGVGENGNSHRYRKEVNPSSDLPHILVVDDDEANRLVMENFLRLENYHVSLVDSAQAARAHLRAGERVDLLVLDIMMPGVSGFELCAELRENYRDYQLPIVFLTAKNQVSDLVKGFDVGANDFVAKPANREELVSRIRLHLSLKAACCRLK